MASLKVGENNSLNLRRSSLWCSFQPVFSGVACWEVYNFRTKILGVGRFRVLGLEILGVGRFSVLGLEFWIQKGCECYSM
jgi:hypothetical protein